MLPTLPACHDGRGPVAAIAVVTDSTADLPVDVAEARGIRVVPMSVSFRGETLISRITISDEEFYARLVASEALPTTSQPSPAWFEEAYADAVDEGQRGIVSIHVAGRLSGTVGVARSRAKGVPIPVEVIDSGQVGGALALAVLATQRRADAGGSLDEVAATAREACAMARIHVVVDSLDYLRRGGRLTGTQAMVGTMLRVKPILTVHDGAVELVARARTTSRALTEVAHRVVTDLDGRACHAVVSHAVAPERAAIAWEHLEDAGLRVRSRLTCPIGPVLGTHTGPGTVAISVLPVG